MKVRSYLFAIFGLLLMSVTGLQAAEDYAKSLAEGDRLRADGQYEKALAEYVAAEQQAGNPTAVSLAIGKQATVYGYDKRDYAKGLELAEKALEEKDIKAVAEVTGLQVKAHCLIHGKKQHRTALKVIEDALKLEGVEWAQPALKLMQGDCYRVIGDGAKALASYSAVLGSNADNGSKAVAQLNIGFIYQYGMKEFDKARGAYKEAVKLNPGLDSEVQTHLQKMGQ